MPKSALWWGTNLTDGDNPQICIGINTVLVCPIIETKNLQSAECLPMHYWELSVKKKPIPAKKKRVTYLYNLRRNSTEDARILAWMLKS